METEETMEKLERIQNRAYTILNNMEQQIKRGDPVSPGTIWDCLRCIILSNKLLLDQIKFHPLGLQCYMKEINNAEMFKFNP